MQRSLLLLTSFALVVTKSTAQVAVSVLEPPSVQGAYEHTWAEPQAGSWATPDMTLVSNAVVDTLALAVDATPADSLCCSAIANAAQINGKIAVLYRGSCDYSEKALNCQNAGAVAVIIINNVAGAPVGMGAGSQGTQVTIPVFQIGQDDGALLRTELDAGSTVVALLGNKTGFFPVDVGFFKNGILMPPSTAEPSWLAGDASEYNFQVAAWVHNYGQMDQSDVQLNAKVSQAGTNLYSETSLPTFIAAGDSVFLQLADFSQPSYGGKYTLTYSAFMSASDGYEPDNTFEVPILIDSLYSLVPIDTVTGRPEVTIGIQPATPNGEYSSCIHFQDANASRVAVAGLDFTATVNSPGNLNGEFIELRIFQWADAFTGLSDPGFAFNSLDDLSATEYIINADTNRFRTYATLDEPIVLEDDMRYLFCVAVFNPAVFFGYNENVHYQVNEDVYDQPTCPEQNGANNWFVGFVGGPVASVTARMIRSEDVGVAELARSRVAPSPNPSTGIFRIGLENFGPGTEITVTDATGRPVHTGKANTDEYYLDLSGNAAGVYLMSVRNTDKLVTARLVLQ